MVCPSLHLSVTWSCIMHESSSQGLTDSSKQTWNSEQPLNGIAQAFLFPPSSPPLASSFSSYIFFFGGFIFISCFLSGSSVSLMCFSYSLFVSQCCVCCILNSHCLSSQRASLLCLLVLFERLIFSSIKTELSRAKVFSIMLLTHIKKVQK